MNRLFGKPKGNVPSQTNLQAHRAKQIDSMKREKLNPIEIIPNTEYRVTFLCGNSNITLIITLPPQFPQDPPTVTVQPVLCHPWVDNQGKIVGCSNLQSFSMHSSLAVAIKSIIDEFKRNPPQIMQQGHFGAPLQYPAAQVAPPYPGYSMPGYPSPPTLPAMNELSNITENRSQTQIEEPNVPPVGNSNIPDVYKAFPDLKSKSLYELNELLNEEDKILEMIQKLPDVCRIVEERETLSRKCIELARENLTKKPTIEQLRQWVTDKQLQFEKTRTEFEQDQSRLLSMSDQFHPTNIQTNLKVALLEAEEESEKVVEEFLSKKIDIEEFRQNFIKSRSLLHSRRAKEEKLNQMILHQGY